MLERGKIASSQLFFLIIGFSLGSIVVVSPLTAMNRQNTWLIIAASLVIGLIYAFFIISLARQFPGKTLVQFNDIIYGPYLGKVISFLYIFYFFYLTSLNLTSFSTFFTNTMLPETPFIVLISVIALLCAVTVRKGIETLGRTSVIMAAILLLIILAGFVLLFKDMDFSNFLPLFNIPVIKFFQGTSISSLILFGETLVFLMIVPFCNKMKQARISFMGAVLIAGLALLIISVQDIAVLGDTVVMEQNPSFQSIRFIDIGDVLTRLEILVANLLLGVGFLKITVLFYVTVLGMAQLLRMGSYLPLVFPIGVLAINIGFSEFYTIYLKDPGLREVDVIIISSFFQLLLPISAMIITKVRGISQQKE